MKNIPAYGAAALLTVLAFQLPALAIAQSSSESSASSSEASSSSSAASSSSSSEMSSSSSSSAPSSSMSSEPSAEPGGKDNWGSLISALQAGKSATDLTTITDATVVSFVTVSSLKADGNTNAL